jgi:transposase
VPRAGPKKVHRYSLEFKLKAVKLSQLKGVEVQAVADALEIHPFMLSRWRKEARDGGAGPAGADDEALSIATARPRAAPRGACAAKKLIRFTSARKPTSLPSSKKSGSGSA